MRAVVQRVSHATVEVGGERVAEMGPGLLALVGVAIGDEPPDAERLGQKLVHLRVFEDDAGRMNHSLIDVGGTLGVVSQFTLLGDVRKGRRPSWVDAAPPETAAPLVEAVAAAAQREGVPVVQGRFRAEMRVALVNEGPVTILLDTANRF